MRYSILGFNQEEVLKLRKTTTKEVRGEVKQVELKLDVTDLLIINHLADFPNRKKVTKIIIDDKIFFWVSYQTIIEELPIIDIKKQALSDRLAKMVELGILERKIQTCGSSANMTFFRIDETYERLKYKDEYNSQEQDVSYSTTTPYSSQTQDVNNIVNNNIVDIEKEDTKVSKKEKDLLFEECWKAYRRKGSKSKAKPYWNKLSDLERQRVKSHIIAYVQSVSELKYQQGFERYLKEKTFNNVVYKGNMIIFDPERENGTDNEYRPQLDGFNLHWNDQTKCYISMYDIDMLFDGYTADNRPASAMVMKNGIRYKWNTQSKKWEVQ